MTFLLWASIGVISLIVTIAISVAKNGVSEVIDVNEILYFVLFFVAAIVIGPGATFLCICFLWSEEDFGKVVVWRKKT